MCQEIALLMVSFAPAGALAEPPAWPQFRGPARSRLASEHARPPTRIGPHTNVQWNAAVPAGASSPVIARGRLFLTDYFDNLDLIKGGKITRDEWDAEVQFRASGKNVAFALTPGGTGHVTRSHVAWTVTKQGLPYIASPLVYRGRMYTLNKERPLSAFDVRTRGGRW